jgi:hypothetical protein
VVRLVALEQLFVDGDGVVDRCGEGIFRREPVEHGDALDLGHPGDGDGFGVAAGIRVESAAVQVEQDFVLVGVGQALGNDDMHRDAGDLVVGDGGRIELQPFELRPGGVFVRPGAPDFEGIMRVAVRSGCESQ